MASDPRAPFEIRDTGAHWSITYAAMAGPCEILVHGKSAGEARHLASLAHAETLRIERKFSRYRDDNIIHAINHGGGRSVALDEETSRMLRYAEHCYELSDGRFDITSGILRRAWTFDGREATPDRALIESLKERVGWRRVEFDGATIRMPAGMEIDLGGIGKEYAVDRVAGLVSEAADTSVLVNFGGDIQAVARGRDPHRWVVGIEEPGRIRTAMGRVEIAQGGVATSGDTHRYCMVEGERLGHMLDPRTGWPVAGAPRSVTVVADTCTVAGFLATLAVLHGPEAESFLEAQDVKYHCIR